MKKEQTCNVLVPVSPGATQPLPFCASQLRLAVKWVTFLQSGKAHESCTYHMPILFLTYSHSMWCSLSFRSTLSLSLVLSPRSGAWLIVSQCLSEEIGEIPMQSCFSHLFSGFISFLCQEEANCSWSPKSWACSKLHPTIRYTSLSYSMKPEGQTLVLGPNMELLQ